MYFSPFFLIYHSLSFMPQGFSSPMIAHSVALLPQRRQ